MDNGVDKAAGGHRERQREPAQKPRGAPGLEAPQKPMGGVLSAGKGLEDTQTPGVRRKQQEGGTGRRVLSSWEEAAAWGGVLTQGLLGEKGPCRGRWGHREAQGQGQVSQWRLPSFSADPRTRANSRTSRGVRREPAMWPLCASLGLPGGGGRASPAGAGKTKSSGSRSHGPHVPPYSDSGAQSPRLPSPRDTGIRPPTPSHP